MAVVGWTPSTRSLLKLSLLSLCIAAGVAILALLGGQFDDTTARVTGTTLAFSVYNATASAGFALLRQERLPLLAIFTILVSAVAFVASLPTIWEDFEDDATSEAWGCLTVGAVSMAQMAVIVVRDRRGDGELIRGIRTVTLALIAGLAGLLILLIVEPGVEEEEGLWRTAGIVAVLDALGTVSLPILRRLQGVAVTPAPSGELAQAAALLTLDPAELDAFVTSARSSGMTVLLGPAADATGRRTAVVENRAGAVTVARERAPQTG